MTIPFYNERTPEYWLQVLQDAHRGLMQTQPGDHAGRSEALQAIQAATNALNSYDEDRVDSTRLSSIPQEVAAIGQGVGQGAKGMVGGVAKIAGDLYHGNPGEAALDVARGLVGTGRNIAGVVEAGLSPDMPEQERLNRIRGGASTLPGLALGTRPVQSAIGRLFGRTPPSGAGPAVSDPLAPIEPSPVDLSKAPGTVPPATPVEDLALPKGGPTVPGYQPNAPAPATPASIEGSLAQIAKGLSGANRPAGFTPTEAPSPAEGAPEPGPASPFGGTVQPIVPKEGFTNPELTGNIAETGSRAGLPQGISVEGPLPKPVPKGGYPPTLAEMHGFSRDPGSFLTGVNPAEPNAPGMFDEDALPASPMRFIGPREPVASINDYLSQIAKASSEGYGRAGFTTTSMLKLMLGVPLGMRLLKSMGVTPEQVEGSPSLASKFMTAFKQGGSAALGSMGPATDSTGTGIGNGNH